MNDKKIQNERNDFHGNNNFSIITFIYILSFELWYDSCSEDGRGVQLVAAESGRDLRLRQEEAEAVPKELRDLCQQRGSTDFILVL